MENLKTAVIGSGAKHLVKSIPLKAHQEKTSSNHFQCANCIVSPENHIIFFYNKKKIYCYNTYKKEVFFFLHE